MQDFVQNTFVDSAEHRQKEISKTLALLTKGTLS